MASVKATAAAAATVVPFHCVICFETFSVDEHPPVVLPCGHTYVCLPCSKRLKRCMECREPLYWTPPSSGGQAKPPPLMPMPTTRLRAVGVRNPPSPPQAALLPNKLPEQIPLPIPKNLVLLTMMEAAEQQARISSFRAAPLLELDYDSDGSELEDDDIAQEECVRLGIGSLSGSCGTYAVRDSEGLAVLPFDPRRGFNHTAEEKKSDEPREPFTIIKGQTVQVANFEDGIAKLARGEGYIVASEQQLVKVGGPLDRSCQLEGLLQMVEIHRRDIQSKLEEIRHLELSLRRQVDQEQVEEPTHPIVSEPPPPQEFIFVEETKRSCPTQPSLAEAPPRLDFGENGIMTPQSPSDSYMVSSADHLGFFSGCGCSPRRPGKVSPNTIVHCDVEPIPAFPRFRRSTSEDDIRSLAFGCGSSLFGDSESQGAKGPDSIIGISFDSTEENAPPSLAATAAQIYRSTYDRQLQSPTANLMQSVSLSSPSFDSVNFRTGMSGHRGLSSAHAASPRPTAVTRGEIRMMSEHRGIGQIRGPSRRRRGGSTSPSFGGHSPHTHHSG